MWRISSRTVVAWAMSMGRSSNSWVPVSHSRQRCVSAKQNLRSSSAVRRQRSLIFTSDVDGFPFDAAEAVEQSLVESWVCVDGKHHLFHGCFELHRGHGFGD